MGEGNGEWEGSGEGPGRAVGGADELVGLLPVLQDLEEGGHAAGDHIVGPGGRTRGMGSPMGMATGGRVSGPTLQQKGHVSPIFVSI